MNIEDYNEIVNMLDKLQTKFKEQKRYSDWRYIGEIIEYIDDLADKDGFILKPPQD